MHRAVPIAKDGINQHPDLPENDSRIGHRS